MLCNRYQNLVIFVSSTLSFLLIIETIKCFHILIQNMYIWEFTGGPAVRQRRQWHPTPVLLPGKSHGRRSLVGCSPWSCWELDTTQWLHFQFSLSCVGEGNGNPLQCFCLENPRDGGAWWAAVYRVTQSRTRLKWLSSSSSSSSECSIRRCLLENMLEVRKSNERAVVP